MSSIAGIVIYRGHWTDSIALFGLGAVNAVFMWLGERWASNAVEVVVPFLMGLLCNTLAYFVDEVCLGTITLGSMLPLYPGKSKTME
jgi:hypothetical protein